MVSNDFLMVLGPHALKSIKKNNKNTIFKKNIKNIIKSNGWTNQVESIQPRSQGGAAAQAL